MIKRQSRERHLWGAMLILKGARKRRTPMKTVTNIFRVSINAKPETVFAYVSELSRHGEWNSGLRIEAVTSGPVSVGSKFHSWGKPGNRQNDIEITDYQPPTRFTFVAHDPNFNAVTHKFTVSSQGDGSLVERTVTAHMALFVWFVWRIDSLAAV
jgi:uncharacterized protein YndB with AHSA1/START domain